MTNWDDLNRRKFPRADYPCLIILGDENADDKQNNLILTHTDNIGVGGVCVAVKQALEMFSPVKLELDLLDLEDHIRCTGKVVWSVQRAEVDKKKQLFYDIGIEFVNIDKRDQERLGKVITRLCKKQKNTI